MERSKQIDIVLNSVFIVVCIVHISLTGYNILFPDLPSIKIQNKDLKDIEFPIFIQMCVSEINNSYDRYTNLGYKDHLDFYLGKSAYNETLYGWSGHSKYGSTLGTVEG